jgi:hypothetical protein
LTCTLCIGGGEAKAGTTGRRRELANNASRKTSEFEKSKKQKIENVGPQGMLFSGSCADMSAACQGLGYQTLRSSCLFSGFLCYRVFIGLGFRV